MSKIVIDAGHGCSSGASNGKYKEDVVALGIAQKLRDNLKDNGHTVIMTRDSDTFVTLKKRCEIANEAKADLFVSIHCNSATNKLAHGIETFKFPNSKHKLADCIQNALVKNFPEEQDRGVKENDFYVLKYTKCPAALVEVGFISHDETAEKLYSYSYQMKLARVICSGIEAYLR